MAAKLRKDLKGVKITSPTFRVSYPNLFKPRAFGDKKDAIPYYSVAMLFDEKTDLTDLKRAITKCKVEAWGKDKTKWPKVQTPFRDGNEKEDQEGYSGCTYANAKSKQKPLIIDRAREKVLDESVIYPGCYARASLAVKLQFVSPNYFAVFYLQGIQFVKDGENLGGGASVEDFDDLEDDSDGDDESDYESGDDSDDGDDD